MSSFLGPALAVIFAGVLHATWNAIAKGAPDRHASMALIGLAQFLVCVPALLVVGPPDRAAWPYLAASTVLHVFYMWLLIRSYGLGDFGQVYPLARGSAPLLVAFAGVAALGESLSWEQLAGVLAVCGGLAALALAGERGGQVEPGDEDEGVRRGLLHEPAAVRAALLTGVSIATYTVLDGVGVRHAGGAVSYGVWMFAIEGPLVVIWSLAVRGRPLLTAMRAQWATGLTGGVISMAGYTIVLWAQTRGTLATVAALRETGVISGAVIGTVFFSERMGPRRIAAACAVACGVVLLTTG